MNFSLYKPIDNALCSKLHTTPSMHHKLPDIGMCCMQNNLLQTKSHVELEDCSISQAFIGREFFVNRFVNEPVTLSLDGLF